MTPGTQLYISVRLMEDEDLADIMRIERNCHEFPWSEGIFQDCLNSGYHCLVAESDYNIVGFAVLLFGAEEAHLLNICVEPHARKQGVAKRLLSDICDTVQRERVTELFLEVRASNSSAINLYSSMGFNQVGLRPDYYDATKGREDALIFALTLAVS